MIFGDFLISEVLEPRIYGFYYTKMLQKILESIWEHLGKILFSISDNQKKHFFRKCVYHISILIFVFIYIYIYIYYFFEYRISILYFTKMRIENDYFPLIESTKAFIRISHLSKNMKYIFLRILPEPTFLLFFCRDPPTKMVYLIMFEGHCP